MACRSRVGSLVVLAVIATSGVHRGATAQTSGDLRIAARVETYADSDRTRVIRPRASIDAAASDRTRLAATYTADVVSSASIDVVTRATQRISDDRHEITGTVTERFGDDRVSVGYAFGTEADFRSHSGTIAFSRPTDSRELGLLVIRAGLGHATIGTVADPDFERVLWTANASASFTRVVNAELLIRAALELANLNGFQSSAYRTVRLGDWTAVRSDGSDPAAGEWVFSGVTATARERTPDERFRARMSFDLVQSIGAGFAVALSFASYADTYRILAAEVSPEIRYEPRRALLFRLGGRAYAQSGAWFWRRRYENTTDTDGFVTDDKELGPMRSYEIHLAAQIPVRTFRLEARIEGDFFRYTEFTLLPEKRALVASIGVAYQP